MSLAVLLTTFVAIFMVELPDKTFVATLVLATRYRPLAVWVGVCLAFAVQTTIAVLLGGLVGRLPTTPVHAVTGLLFLIGGVLLLRGASRAQAEEEEAAEEFSAKATATGARAGWAAVLPSFLLLFAAEWGDLSQLLTASLVARYDDPWSVGVGAFAALATVSALGAALGNQLLKKVSLATVRRVGGVICLILATITLLGVAGVDIPLIG